jgi:tRNA threonylcarbamoyladenosine biosynthesis protein TsaB
LPASAPLTLAIDAAGSCCGAAVAAGAELLAIANAAMRHGQAEALLPIIDEVVRGAGLTPPALQLVAVTTGPGSFTGIRVGIASAHGIALALQLPLIGVSSFEAVAAAVPVALLTGRRLLVALDSRRGDFYVQLFDDVRRPLSEPATRSAETLADFALCEEVDVCIAGDAAACAARALAARALSQGVEVITLEAAPPVAGALRAAQSKWQLNEQVKAVRPFYLRPPNVRIPGGRNS